MVHLKMLDIFYALFKALNRMKEQLDTCKENRNEA